MINKKIVPTLKAETKYLSIQNKYTAYKNKKQVKKIDFNELNKAVQKNMPNLIYNLLPHGVMHFDEWFALNPTRYDRHIGSFSINTKSWKFYDFATREGGHGAIALYAYVKKISYFKAAKTLQKMLEGKNG